MAKPLGGAGLLTGAAEAAQPDNSHNVAKKP
jgi:hypothetical protein